MIKVGQAVEYVERGVAVDALVVREHRGAVTLTFVGRGHVGMVRRSSVEPWRDGARTGWRPIRRAPEPQEPQEPAPESQEPQEPAPESQEPQEPAPESQEPAKKGRGGGRKARSKPEREVF